MKEAEILLNTILRSEGLFLAMTGKDLTKSYSKVSLQDVLDKKITSEDIILALKAMCKVCNYMDETVCPIVEKL